MLSLNGAKQELLNIVLRLERQICKQVAPPQAAPIAAFHRLISINDRVVADPFFVWDESGEKFVVAHLLDAFALYQIAVARKNPDAEATVVMIRDRWVLRMF